MEDTGIIRYKFRERLSELMKEKNINQTALANAIKCSRKTINEYINGRSCPRNDLLGIIARYFGVTKEYLIGTSDCRNLFGKIISESEEKVLKRHLDMLRYFDEEYGLDDYDRGEGTILESHTEIEIVDGKEVEVQYVDNFEDDYTRLLEDIERYVQYKTTEYKKTHDRISTKFLKRSR